MLPPSLWDVLDPLLSVGSAPTPVCGIFLLTSVCGICSIPPLPVGSAPNPPVGSSPTQPVGFFSSPPACGVCCPPWLLDLLPCCLWDLWVSSSPLLPVGSDPFPSRGSCGICSPLPAHVLPGSSSSLSLSLSLSQQDPPGVCWNLICFYPSSHTPYPFFYFLNSIKLPKP